MNVWTASNINKLFTIFPIDNNHTYMYVQMSRTDFITTRGTIYYNPFL